MRRTRFGLANAAFALLSATAVVFAQSAQTATPLPAPARRPTLTPVKTAGPVSESDAKEGKQLFAKVVESLGGKAKVARVHDM